MICLSKKRVVTGASENVALREICKGGSAKRRGRTPGSVGEGCRVKAKFPMPSSRNKKLFLFNWPENYVCLMKEHVRF